MRIHEKLDIVAQELLNDFVPSALWLGEASVERRIHLLQMMTQSLQHPQFSSTFYPRTMLTTKGLFHARWSGSFSRMSGVSDCIACQ